MTIHASDDEQGHKGILNRFHEQEVCEDVLTERLAAYSSRDFLKEGEHRFAGFLGNRDGSIIATFPPDIAHFYRIARMGRVRRLQHFRQGY